MNHIIFLTHDDRRRLGTVLESIHADGTEQPDDLRALEALLEDAQGLDLADLPQDVVMMNSTVKLCDLDTREVETYTIVYPEQADISRNRMSVLAPIGAAVLGCRVDDIVEVDVPSGRRRIRVEAIRHRPKETGNGHIARTPW